MTSETLDCKKILERFCKVYELNLNEFQDDGEWHAAITPPTGRPCVCYSAIDDSAYLSARSNLKKLAFKNVVDLILYHDCLAWIDEDGNSRKLDMSSITTLEELAILVDLG